MLKLLYNKEKVAHCQPNRELLLCRARIKMLEFEIFICISILGKTPLNTIVYS